MKFFEFKASVGKGTSWKLKSLRSDNGDEFVSNTFKKFCAQEATRREPISPHNPKQNGVAENKNIIIVREARDMLHDQELPLNILGRRMQHKILFAEQISS